MTQMRDFIAVVDAGSFTRAATVLGISQPAVSQRMAQLEAAVGTRLLERGPRGIEPTAVGLVFYRGAQELVRRHDQLTSALAAGGEELRGTVVVGLPATVAGLLTPELFALVRRRHPGIRLDVFESMSGYVAELLGRHRLDLAVLFREDAGPRPGEVVLYREELFLIRAARPDDPDEDPGPVRVPDLTGVPLVAPGARSNLRDLVERAFAVHGLVPDVVADVGSLPAMVRIAQSGTACAILPRSSVEGVPGPPLRMRPVVDPELRRWVSVCLSTDLYEPRAAVVAVRDAVVDAVRDLAARDAWPGIRTASAPPHQMGLDDTA
ncbi:LysR substrate-binding domain-containing protein [Geodermatophilus sp. SYSU D01105]